VTCTPVITKINLAILTGFRSNRDFDAHSMILRKMKKTLLGKPEIRDT
jgi:hypothetical protein